MPDGAGDGAAEADGRRVADHRECSRIGRISRIGGGGEDEVAVEVKCTESGAIATEAGVWETTTSAVAEIPSEVARIPSAPFDCAMNATESPAANRLPITASAPTNCQENVAPATWLPLASTACARNTSVSPNDEAVAATGVTVTLASGKTLTGRLLIGADGRSSGTAARAGIRRTGWGYGQTALVAAIEHELPHHGIAHQFFMPPGPLAILPLTGNRSLIVWSEASANAAAINALPDAQYLEVLRPRFGSFLGELSLTGPRYSYPLGLSLAHSMTAPRVALLGDAAHGVHPIAGQGLNAGLRDVAALAEVIADAVRRGEDPGNDAVLARYQEWRRFDNASLALATDSFNRLFSNDNALLRLARDMGMAAINALPGLRRTFIREAAGLTGDLPRLMRGKPL